MKIETWDALNNHSKILRRMEKMLLAAERQRAVFEEDGLPDVVLASSETYLLDVRREVDAMKRVLPKLVADEPLGEWVAGTLGIGPAVIYLAGLLPPLVDFPNPAKVSKYIGMDVRDGKAPRREKGSFAGFDSYSRSVAVARIGFPIEKCPASPYRRIYENRKEYTRITHPPIMPEGECEFCDKARGKTKKKREESNQTRERKALGFDCSNVGGVHWTDAHRRMDAIRVTVKAVLLDLWLVENGKEPKLGQVALDTHPASAHAEAL